MRPYSSLFLKKIETVWVISLDTLGLHLHGFKTAHLTTVFILESDDYDISG